MPLQIVAPQRLYRQIAEKVRQLMASGEFELGSCFLAERDLAEQLNLSRPSVCKASLLRRSRG